MIKLGGVAAGVILWGWPAVGAGSPRRRGGDAAPMRGAGVDVRRPAERPANPWRPEQAVPKSGGNPPRVANRARPGSLASSIR